MMKKVLLSLVAILIINAGSAKAQTVWGIRAGIGTPIAISEGEHISGKLGLEIGPTAYISLSDKLYLNAAAMYSMKTFGGDGEYSASLTLHYLEIPAYFGYRVPLGKIDTYVQAGPYVAFKIAESFSIPGFDTSDFGFDTSDFESDTNSFHAGLAIMYGININRFKIEVGVKYGLSSIEQDWNTRLATPFFGVSYIF